MEYIKQLQTTDGTGNIIHKYNHVHVLFNNINS